MPKGTLFLKVWETLEDLCIFYKDSKNLDNQPYNWYNMYMWLDIDDLEAVE